jgi:CO/xanthine dehydrogenase FAD-binding subunit
MLKPFTLLQPDTVEQCAEILRQQEDAKVLAGGTDIFVEMHAGKTFPVLVDIKGIRKLHGICFDEEKGLEIGALATMGELLEDINVQRYYPALADAMESIGSVQVRNKATVAGNICNASPAADTAVPLILYDASLKIAGHDGERLVAITDFFTGPKKTCLRKGEFVISITLSPPAGNGGSGYVKLKKRGAMEIGIMGAGVRFITDNGGKCVLVRVGMAAVNPTPLRLKAAEDFIVGRELSDENLKKLVNLAYEAAEPHTWRNSEEWSRDMVKVYVPEAIRKAFARKQNGGY